MRACVRACVYACVYACVRACICAARYNALTTYIHIYIYTYIFFCGKSRAYRARLVRSPRQVLAEFGTELDAHVKVIVHDSTAECRYIVLPMRPEGTAKYV